MYLCLLTTFRLKRYSTVNAKIARNPKNPANIFAHSSGGGSSSYKIAKHTGGGKKNSAGVKPLYTPRTTYLAMYNTKCRYVAKKDNRPHHM